MLKLVADADSAAKGGIKQEKAGKTSRPQLQKENVSMKRNEGKKRVLSLLLALCMVLSYVPATVLAVEDGSCDHHSHDESCGYVKAVEGEACGHVCPENCPLESVAVCIHDHEVLGCTYLEAEARWDCDHACAEDTGCITQACAHVCPGDECGFVQQVEGQKCGFVCEVCASEEAVKAVKAAVAALPAVDAANAMSNEELGGKNNSIQSAYEAYNDLTDDQKAQLSTEYEKLVGLLGALSDPGRVAPAAVTSGKCGDSANWEISGSVLTISGSGAMYDYAENPAFGDMAPWLGSYNSITSVVVKSGITYVGARAFLNLRKVTSLSLPGSVTAIGQLAFSGMTGLQTLTLPWNLTKIPDGLCLNCEALTTVKIPKSVTEIGIGALGFSTGVSTIYYGGTETDWQGITKKESAIPSSNVTIYYASPVTLPSGTGYTAAAVSGSASPVMYGDSFSFTVTVESGYIKSADFKVLANGTPLTESDGVYTISNITESQTVTVEGVVPVIDYGITINYSTKVTDANLQGTNWRYDPTSNVLYLNNGFNSSITSSRDTLTMEVSGTVTVGQMTAKGSALTVRGNGDSTQDVMDISTYGLKSYGNLTVENLKLTAKHTKNAAILVGATDASEIASGCFTVRNATVRATTSNSGYTYGISTGTLIVEGNSYVYGSSSTGSIPGIAINKDGSSFSSACHVEASTRSGTGFEIGNVTVPQYAYLNEYNPNDSVYKYKYEKVAAATILGSGYRSSTRFEFIGVDHVSCQQNADGSTHALKCACGTTVGESVACSGGTATCTNKAVCSLCGKTYGDLLPHSWTYSKNDAAAKISADCDNCDATGSFTLKAPADKVYDNKAAEATVEGSISGVDTPTIEYGGDLTDGKAVKAGYYTASITAGGQTVTVSFTIRSAAASVTAGDETTYYETLPEAITAAAAAENSVLKLLKDSTPTETLTVTSGKFTLDLNSYSIRNGSRNAIEISSGATLTVTDSKTGGEIYGKPGYNAGGGIINNGTLYLQGGTISYENGSSSPASVTNRGTFVMSGGTIAGRNGFLMNTGTATFNGGTVSGMLDINGGAVTITGGSFTNTSEDSEIKDATVTISGGTFEKLELTGKSETEISGGTFNRQVLFSGDSAVLTGGIYKGGVKNNSGTNAPVTKLLAEGYAFVEIDTEEVLDGQYLNVMAMTHPCKVMKFSGTIAVRGITLTPETATLTIGQTQQFAASVTPANATNQQLSWSSDAPGVATVDETGKVTAVSAGTAQITVAATDNSGISATAVVTVGKKTLTSGDFNFTAPEAVYNGIAKTASVTPVESITDVGAVTVSYYNADGTTKLDGAPVHVGTYLVKIQVAESNTYNAAVDLTDSGWTLQITKKAVTITAKDQAVTYGTDISKTPDMLTYTLQGSDRVLSCTLTPSTTQVTDDGTITPADVKICAGASDTADVTGNYDITYETGKLVIRPADMAGSVTAQGWEGTYDGNSHGITVTAPEGAVVTYGTAEDTCNLSTSPAYVDAGEYTVYFTAQKDNHEPVTGSATVKIAAKEIGIQWSEEPLYYKENTPQAPAATATGLITGADNTADECTITVSGAAIDAGMYTATATALSNPNYKLPAEVSKTFTILPATRSKPSGVSAASETIRGKADGKLLDVEDGMQYRKDGETAYTNITGEEVTGLAAGKYYVRYAATNNHAASEEVEVTVGAGRTLKVYLPENQTGYTITANRQEVGYNGTVKLTYQLAAGYTEGSDFAVTATSGTITKNSDGSYTVSGIRNDAAVTVTGVRDVTPPTAEIKVEENKWSDFLNSITFSLFFKQKQNVTITAADAGAGVKTVEYCLRESAMTKEQVAAITDWTGYNGTFSIEEEKQYVIYAKVTDGADNVLYVSSNGLVLDMTPPVIDGVDDGGTYYTTQKVTTTDGNMTLNGVRFSGEIPGNRQASYEIAAWDQAGNRAVVSITMLPISTLRAGLPTDATVELKDETGIEAVRARVSTILSTQCTYATAEEKEELEAIIADCDDLLDKIQQAKMVIALINAMREAFKVSPDDKDDIDRYDAARAAYDSEKLPAASKRMVGAANKKKLDDMLAALTDYKIIAQSAAYYVKGSEKPLTITANGYFAEYNSYAAGAYGKFTGLEVDGKVLNSKNYTVKAGSTVVTLKTDYLDDLKDGKHTIKFYYLDGSTSESETFRVYTNNGSAFTGDDNSVILWCSAIFVSAMCMLIFLLVPRKKGKYLR